MYRKINLQCFTFAIFLFQLVTKIRNHSKTFDLFQNTILSTSELDNMNLKT